MRRTARARREAGSATAETAVALPALLVVLAGALTVLSAVSAQLRCVDAARLAARSAARGDSEEATVRAAREVSPAAVVTVRREGDLVRVRVELGVGPLPGSAGPLTVAAEAAAMDEGRAALSTAASAVADEPTAPP